jgi:hypothetical protein
MEWKCNKGSYKEKDLYQKQKLQETDQCEHEFTGIPTTEESWCIKCGQENHIIEKELKDWVDGRRQ